MTKQAFRQLYNVTYQTLMKSGQFITVGLGSLQIQKKETGENVDAGTIVSTNGIVSLVETIDDNYYYIREALEAEKDHWRIHQLGKNPRQV